MPRHLVTALALLLGATTASAQTCAFTTASTRFEAFLPTESLAGGAVLVGDRQGLLFERYYGNYTANTVVPIASASKWLSGVRIAQLIDRGAIDPEAPVSTYLPQFTGDKGTMSVRQMFSHTAGYGDDSGSAVLFDESLTLAQAVDQIACCRPLNTGYTVGGQFSYGGVSMHIGGRVAEVVSNGDWQAGWIAEIGAPLGTTTIDWQGLGPTLNYGIAGSARSNLRDYGRVLAMINNDGRGNNRQIISAQAARRFQVDQVGDLPVAYAPANAGDDVHYGMGSWIDYSRGPNSAPLVHSLGAFGYFPWIDYERHVFGVFMIRGGAGINSAALPVYRAMLADIAAEYDANACAHIELTDAMTLDDFEDQP
jgi:CubicO group peptidase (beta-lactamase class C family)